MRSNGAAMKCCGLLDRAGYDLGMATYTPKQGQYLAFIHYYTLVNGQPPAEHDMERYFRSNPTSVHQMVLTLEKRGFIQRTPGKPRSIRLLVPREELPDLTDPNATVERTQSTARKRKASIFGHWRITHMEQWDQDFVDAEVEGYIRFDQDGGGEFQFGYVHGQMVCEMTERDGKPTVEWSWEGNDEMDEASGRGWAYVSDDGLLRGKLFVSGDGSEFEAVKKPGRVKKVESRRLRIIWPPKKPR